MEFSAKTPLINLYDAAHRYSEHIAFKIPLLHPETRDVLRYDTVTYSQFLKDVQSFAMYWSDVLSKNGVTAREVVTLFLKGYTYMDVLHIYGLSRAGYIPQPLTLVPTATFITQLLQESGSKAVIYEPFYAVTSAELDIRKFETLSSVPSLSVSDIVLPEALDVQAEDIAIFFHTSGSTSGKPKIVPGTDRWLDGLTRKSTHTISKPIAHSPLVFSWLGSVCHMGQFASLVRVIGTGSAIVQPIDSSNSPSDLIKLIPTAAITNISLFPVALMQLLRRARVDEELKKILVSLHGVSYSGGSLPREDEQWASANGINLINIYATTECAGLLMASEGSRFSSHNALRLIDCPGVEYSFSLLESGAEKAENGHEDIKELVILPESIDFPHPSLRSADGVFHTGDLFREVLPSYYINCGRDDDWIKMANAARCDTR
ncbi:hypothetical protein D9758_015473 [Tetrapyrgos nigripes]|uniref:AMP-dependent synthetase/ligase domain-containing protein n=1 Tax=Tetrapyrgos nigripes TaxID=182062 RepID=A0A8H5CP10_9AGAR|nr:hypothetical protein D9758_015473 [Tetrapyrgos nigripes]